MCKHTLGRLNLPQILIHHKGGARAMERLRYKATCPDRRRLYQMRPSRCALPSTIDDTPQVTTRCRECSFQTCRSVRDSPYAPTAARLDEKRLRLRIHSTFVLITNDR